MRALLSVPLRWLGKHELGSLLTLSTLAGGGLAFATIAAEVTGTEPGHLDRQLLLALREPTNLSDPIGPAWVEEAGRDFTALGGKAVLTLVTVAVIGHLLLRRRPRSALFLALSVIGGALFSSALKELFARPRPALVTHLAYVTSPSFPSGHSMLSSVVYLTLAGLLARSEASLIRKAYILLWAMVLALLVGLSRVYIGVHWPSDVLAGWAAGAAWAALCGTLARALQRSGDVEPPEASPAESAQPEPANQNLESGA